MSQLSEDALLFKIYSKEGSTSIHSAVIANKADYCLEYKKSTLRTKFPKNVSLQYLVENLPTKESIDPTYMISIILKCFDCITFQNNAKWGSLNLLTPSKLNTSELVIDIDSLFEVSYGKLECTLESDSVYDLITFYTLLGFAFLSVRLNSYTGEGITLRSQFKNRAYEFIKSKNVGTSIILTLINGPDSYFAQCMGNDMINSLASVFDAVLISNPNSMWASLRLTTLSCYHKDNSTLLKMYNLINLNQIDTSFCIESIIVDSIAFDLMKIIDPKIKAFEPDTVIPYMRSLNLVSKSIFSASEVPNLHTYLSTLLALFDKPRYFQVIMTSVSTEVGIFLAYFVYKAHQSSSKIGDFFSTTGSANLDVVTKRAIENKPDKILQIKNRWSKGYGLTGQELTELQKLVGEFGRRANTIGARIMSLTPIQLIDIDLNSGVLDKSDTTDILELLRE